MIYVLLTYLFYPVLWIIIRLRRRQDIQRILVIQTAKIGDVVCSTPVFRALAQQFPHAHITVLMNLVTQELLEGNPHVDATVAIRPEFYAGLAGKLRLARLIRDGRYDVAVCMNPNVPFAVGLFWGLVPIRLSVMPNFAGSTFRLASGLFAYLAAHSSERLVMQTYFDALKYIGVDNNDFAKQVTKASGADKKVATLLTRVAGPVIGVAITSGNKLKEIRPEKIAGLINMLLSRLDVCVALIGSTADREHVSAITSRLENPGRVIDAVGSLGLNELPALFERLAVFVGVDSGLTFMADACATPIVEISGPGPIKEQRPLGRHCIIIQKDLPCVPCLHIFKTVHSCRIKTRECIESVGVDEIYNAVFSLLQASRDMSGEKIHSHES
jgi:ADP-heptose:LPS heptosyltransferase